MEYFILSDLKFSEGYANAKLSKYDQAIQAYLESHNYAKKSILTKLNNLLAHFMQYVINSTLKRTKFIKIIMGFLIYIRIIMTQRLSNLEILF